MPRAAKKPKGPSRPRKRRPTVKANAGVDTTLLDDKSIPLLQAVNWQIERLSKIHDPEEFLHGVDQVAADVSERLRKILKSKNDELALKAVYVYQNLRLARDERMAKLAESLQATGRSSTLAIFQRQIAELQHEVEMGEAGQVDTNRIAAAVGATLMPTLESVMERKIREALDDSGTTAS